MINNFVKYQALLIMLVVQLNAFSQSMKGFEALADSSESPCDINDLCRLQVDSTVEMLVQKDHNSRNFVAFANMREITGASMNFFEDGKISSITGYYLGCEDGLDIGFYPNGIIEYYGYNVCLGLDKIREEHYLTNDDTGEAMIVKTERWNSVQHGVWRFFNEMGELEKTETWDMGVLVK